MIFIGLIVIVIVIAVYVISTSNRLKVLTMKVEEAGSSVDIMIDKRYKILTESLKVAKAYVKHEEELFTKLLRSQGGTRPEVIESQDHALNSLLAVGNMYPELKSNAMYTKLMDQIEDQTEQFAAAKRAYNAAVTTYNKTVVMFPSSLIAGMFGYMREEFIKESDVEAKRDFTLDI